MLAGSPTRRRARALLAITALALAGCPAPPAPTRDGGTPCTSESDCNPAGVSCGIVHLCIHDPDSGMGLCSDSTEVRACADGAAYPDSSVVPGDCLEYQDCNPESMTCGTLFACTNYHCDTTPTLVIPCDDGGGTDAGDADPAEDAGDVDASVTDF